MFGQDAFSVLPFSDDGLGPREFADPPAPVIHFNNKTLTFPLRINRVLEFKVDKVNRMLEFSLNRNSIIDHSLSINRISEHSLNRNTVLEFTTRR